MSVIDFNRVIETTEKKWLPELYEFTRGLFKNVHLPSHDHTHHYRVWKYTGGLLQKIHQNGRPVTETEAEILLIASLFHDTGMTIDPGPQHGKISKAICNQFFLEKETPPCCLDKISNIIELHDDKRYEKKQIIDNSTKFLLNVLNGGDDLDAFGYIGIYRYTEIYLTRKIPIRYIPEKVIDNLDKRFENIMLHFGMLSNHASFYRKEYLVTRKFFEQAIHDFTGVSLSTGSYQNILETIQKYIVDKKYTPERLNKELQHLDLPVQTKIFFQELTGIISAEP